MKKRMTSLVVLCLLFAVQTPILAAPGPDGFYGVPWGATQDQVAKEMAAQGNSFNQEFKNPNLPGVEMRYNGTLANTRGLFCFTFLNGALFQGAFFITNDDAGYVEKPACKTFYSIISSKYGSPTTYDAPVKNFPDDLWTAKWEGLQAPGSSDTVRILIDTISGLRGSVSWCTLQYTNQSLQQRLTNQGINRL